MDYSISPRLQEQVGSAPHARWSWTANRCRVLELVIEGKLTLNAIADEIGVKRDTVDHWVRHPRFKEERAKLEAQRLEDIQRITIAKKIKRIEAAQQRHDKMNAVIDARAN